MFTTYLKYILHELEIRHIQRVQFETVLVMQGGGSLGAYECGVYKTLSKHGVNLILSLVLLLVLLMLQ
jgi:predicted acylesterase/phospholipase RssA